MKKLHRLLSKHTTLIASLATLVAALPITLYAINSQRTLSTSAATAFGNPLDPTDTDEYVNRFLLAEVAKGDKRIAAGGSWWNPVDKFFENQLWVVAKDVQPGKVYPPSSAVPLTLTCLMPGKTPGKGSARNSLSFPNILYNMGNNTPAQVNGSNGNTLEQWHTLTRNGNSDGSIEQRARCQAFETLANPFNDPVSPNTQGDEERANLDMAAWFGDLIQEPQSDQTRTANHLAIPNLRQDIIDAHAWYDNGVEYTYSVPNNFADLIGKTVSGTIFIDGFALVCRKPNCPHDNNVPINVHHHALKIEINNKDYWVTQHLTQPTDAALDTSLRDFSKVSFQLDTTKIPDGWHILSHHMHGIDKRNVAGFTGKQLAAETKIAICVNNTNQGACSTTNSPTPTTNISPSMGDKMGDVNGDGLVNLQDYMILFENYGKQPVVDMRADLNKDGRVNVIDYTILFENYGRQP